MKNVIKFLAIVSITITSAQAGAAYQKVRTKPAEASLMATAKLPATPLVICEQTNDGCNTCIRRCGDDGWSCTSAYCPSNQAMCEKNAMEEKRNPKDCLKHKVKP